VSESEQSQSADANGASGANGAGEGSFAERLDALMADGNQRGAAQLLEEGALAAETGEQAHALAVQFLELVEGALDDKKRARRVLQQLGAKHPGAVALHELEADFLVRIGDPMQALELYEKVAQAEDTSAAKAAAWERMGDLCLDRMERPQDALVHYQAAFRAHRAQTSAIRKAAGIYLADGREEQAKQLIDLEVEVNKNDGNAPPSELADLYAKVAEGLLVKPSAHKVAEESLVAALEIAPGHPRATELKEELDAFPSRWKEHVRRLRDAALDARDKREAARRYLSIAMIYREYVPDDPEQMQQNVDKCLLLQPGHRPALMFLEEVYRSGGRVAAFIDYLKKQAEAIRTVDVATDLWLYIVVLMAEQGATPDELAEAYERIRKIDPRNLPAISGLYEVHLQAGRYEEAAAVMESFLSETSDPAAKRSTLRQLARIYEVELGQLDKAAERYEDLLRLGGDASILLSLVGLYDRAGNAERLAGALEELSRTPAASEYEDGGGVRVLERLFELYQGELNEPERAFQAACRLFGLAPRDTLEEELRRLADALARPADLGDAYLAAADASDDATDARTFRLKAARAFVTGGDSRRGRKVLTILLDIDKRDREALELLDRILEREADPEELAGVLEARLLTQDDAAERAPTLLSLAEAYDRMHRASDAIARLTSILEDDPQHAAALEKLDTLYRREEQYPALADILERRVRQAEEQQRLSDAATLKTRLARLCDERLARGDDAARLYLELYDHDSDNPDTVRALERLLDRSVATVAIASALQPYYAQAEAWRRHVEMIQIRRDAEEDPARRGALSRTMAEILEERLKSPREAFEAWSAALLDDPSSGEVVRTLERLADVAQLHARFAEVIERAAEKLPDGVGKNALMARRAALLQGVLGNADEAIKAHEALLQNSPGHLPSLDALADLHAQTGDHAKLKAILERRLELSPEEEAAAVAARLGALLLDELADADAAEAVLRQAVSGEHALAGQDRKEPLERLAQILRGRLARLAADEAGDDDAAEMIAASLTEILGGLADCLAGTERAQVRVEQGDLLRERLQQGAAALDAYEAALANDRQSPGALAGLRGLLDDTAVDPAARASAGKLLLKRYEGEGNAAGRVHVLEMLLTLEQDAGRRRALVHSQATLLSGELEMPEEAFSALIAHVERDPDDEQAVTRLETLAPVVEKEWELVALYQKLRAHEDPQQAREFAERLAGLTERIGDLEAAAEALRHLLTAEPDRADFWERLRSVYDKQQDVAGIADCLTELARLSSGPAQIARLQVLADFAFEVLEDPERGLQALRQCRQLLPDDDGILSKLHGRLLSYARFEELTDVLAARVERADAAQHAASLLLELGQIYLDHLTRPSEAVEVLKRCLTVERDGNSTQPACELLERVARQDDDISLVALDVIIEHHRAQQAWQPLIESLEIAAAKRPSGPERARLYDDVSKLQEEALRTPQLAFRAACLAFKDDPTQERSTRVFGLADATASFSELMAVMEDVAHALAESDPERSVRLYRLVIDIAARRLDDADTQVRAAEAILRLDKTDAEALALLESIHRKSADDDQLIEVLRRRAETAGDDEERFAALIEMGQLVASRGDDEEAERCFRQVLHGHDNHVQALQLLDDLYARTGNSASHVEVLERRISVESNEVARAELRVRMAMLKLTRRGDPAGATDELSKACAEAAASPVVRQGLETLVAHARQHGTPPLSTAAHLLESSIRAQGDWSAVANVMELRLSGEVNHVSRAGLLLEMAQLQEVQLEQPLMAFKTVCRCLSEVPEDAAVRKEAERLATATESLETLAIVYDDILESVQDPELRAHLNRRMAQIAEQVGGDSDEARSRLLAAVEAGGADLDTLQNLVRLTREGGQPHELAHALGRLAEVAGEQGAIEVAKEAWAELREVLEETGDLGGAISAGVYLINVDPQDMGARAAVERLLTRAERWRDLETHLKQWVEVAGTPEQQAEVLTHLIHVRVTYLTDFEGGVTSLEQLQMVLPSSEAIATFGARILQGLAQVNSPEAATWRGRVAILLEPRYEAAQAWQELTHILRMRLDITSDPGERKKLWVRIVDLYETRLDNPEQAFLYLSRALGEDPGDTQLRERAERVAVRLGDMETLVGLYEDIVEQLPDGDELKVGYAVRAGELYEGGLGAPDEAAVFYEKALSFIDPEEDDGQRRELLERVEGMYRAMHDPGKLASALRRQAEMMTGEDEQDAARQHLFEAATIQIHGLQDYGAAIDTLHRLLKIAPHDLPALRSLADACERQERWSELADALDRELVAVGNTDPDRSLAARFRLAVVLDTKLSLADDASAHFQAILAADPQHAETRSYLERRMASSDGPMRSDEAKFLEEAYEATGDWPKAVEVLQQQLAEVERRGDRPEARDLCLRIAEIQETHLQMEMQAFVTLCRALKHDPGSDVIRGRLHALAKANETLEELAEVYEDEASSAEGAGRSSVASELREQAARIYATDLAEPGRAIETFEAVLEKQPGREPALEGLIDLYAQTGRWDDHERILRRRLMFLDEPQDRAPLLMLLAKTVADHLDRPEDALGLLKEVRGLVPEHIEARRLMIELVEFGDDAGDLRALLEEEIQHCRESEDVEGLRRSRRRLAMLLARDDTSAAHAIPLWEEIRADEGADDASFIALERLYPLEERWEDLRVLYEGELEGERDPQRISALTQKLGELLADKLGGADEAIRRHENVLQLDPKNAESNEALRRLFRSINDWERLVSQLRKMMRFATDPVSLKDLRFELAQVVGQHLDKRAEAVETGRRILDIEPHSPDELDRLAGIFRDNEAWEELADVVERNAAQLDGEMKIRRLLDLAEIHEEKLGRSEAAAPAYQAILDVDASHTDAYEKLAATYEKMAEWQRLIALKEQRLGTLTTPADRIPLLSDVIQIYEQQLAQKDMAFIVACRAYPEDYANDDIAATLDRLAVETDDVDTLVELYDEALGTIHEEARVIRVHLRMAELQHKHLHDPDAAETHLKRVLEYSANHPDAIDRLVALYRSQERWGEAQAYLERKAEAAGEVDGRIQVHLNTARMLDEQARDVDGAVAAYKRALELDGGNLEALKELADLLERAERWQQLIGILGRQEEVAEAQSERTALRYRVAGIWENELENAEQAIAVYRSIFEDDPGHQLSLKALERLFTTLSRPGELIGVFEQMLERAAASGDVPAPLDVDVDSEGSGAVPAPDSSAEQVRLLSKIATTWEEGFENLEKAVEAHERILHLDDANIGAIKTLERLLRQLGEWERLVEVMLRHVTIAGAEDDDDEVVRLYREVGEVYYKELGNTAKAEEFYNAALENNPESREALHELGQLYERSGNWFNALEKLTREAELAGTTPDGVDLYYRIGKINEDMLLDVENAKGSYDKALDIDPGHIPSLQALKDIAYQQQKWDTYLKWLRTEAQYTDDEWARTDLYTTAGRFLQEHESDLETAADEFEKALAVTYDHLEAAQPLAEICFRNENWERAENLLEIICERLDPAEEQEELVRQHYRLGYVCEKLAKDQKALKNYQRAYELDATYLPGLEGLGAALNRAERWEDASKIYQAILIHHRDGLTDAEVVDYYQQLAALNFKLSQNERAQKNLEKALELDSAHVPSLRLLADIHSAQQEWEDAYEVLIELAPLVSHDERVSTLVEIGRLSKDELEDPYRAIDAYEDASHQRPGDKEILEALLGLYRETRQGGKAVEVLEELVRIEPDEKSRVRLNYTLGEVYRDEMKNEGRALQYFNAALDLDPSYIKAFEAIETMLSSGKQWSVLEENYIAMLRRIPDERGGIKMVLWRNLGDLYRFKLKSVEGAAQAYSVLHKADTDNVEVLEILGGLLARIPKRLDEAILTYEKLLPRAGERRKKVLHDLVGMYLNRKKADQAFLAVGALRVLGDANPEEQKLYQHYARLVPAKPSRALTDRLWGASLIHEHARGPLLDISMNLWRAAGALLVRSPKDFGLQKGRYWTRLELEGGIEFFVKVTRDVRDAMSVGPVELYVRKGVADPIAPLPVQVPTLGIGEGSDVRREMPERQLRFLIARQMAYLHPGFILPRLLGAQGFSALVETAFGLINNQYPAQSDPRVLGDMVRVLQQVPAVIGPIRPSVEAILATGKPAPIKEFLEGVEHTAIRAAFVMSGDIELAGHLLRQPDTGPMPLPYRPKMEELLAFAVSPAHYDLRERLGLSIGK
jgi:tetratricopeptide (TPR) repeat protein